MNRIPNHDSTHRSNDAVCWGSFYTLTIVVSAMLFFPYVYSGSDFNPGPGLILLAITFLTIKRWTGAFLMVLCQTMLLLLEPQASHQQVFKHGLVWLALPVFLIMAVSRFRTLQERNPQTLRGVFAPVASFATNVAVPTSLVQNFGSAVVQLLRTGLLITGCSISAWIIMKMVPIGDADIGFSTLREFRLKASGYRLLILGLSIFVVYVLTWIAVTEISWRKLSPSQASIFLRSVFIKYYHRDLRMITLKRLKIRRKRARSIQPVSPDEFPAAVKGKT